MQRNKPQNPRFLNPQAESQLEELLGGLGVVSEEQYQSGNLEGYRFVDRLSSGGEGTADIYEKDGVWYIGKTVQLKREILEATREGKRLVQEANTLNSLNHPAIPKHHGFFWLPTTRETISLREYFQGQSLADIISTGAASEADVLDMIEGMAPILAYLHDKEIIHRDIKPGNIIKQPSGAYALVDFGIAKVENTLTTHTEAPGSQPYIAPEQNIGRPVPGSDIFSLGITGIHLALGELPEQYRNGFIPKELLKLFDVERSEELPDQLKDPVLRKVLGQMIRFDHRKRIVNGAALEETISDAKVNSQDQGEYGSKTQQYKLQQKIDGGIRSESARHEHNEATIHRLERMVGDWRHVYKRVTRHPVRATLSREELGRPWMRAYADMMQEGKQLVKTYKELRRHPQLQTNNGRLKGKAKQWLYGAAPTIGTVMLIGDQTYPLEISLSLAAGTLAGLGNIILNNLFQSNIHTQSWRLEEAEADFNRSVEAYIDSAEHIVSPKHPDWSTFSTAQQYLEKPLFVNTASTYTTTAARPGENLLFGGEEEE